MELKRYLRIALKGWWVVLTVLAVSTAATYYFIDRQPAQYRSTGTFVVRPRSLDAEEMVRAFDTLIRGVEINATYATIARSNVIRSRAEARIDPALRRSSARIDAEVLTGTNIVSITARAPDPASAQTLAAAIGNETAAFVSELNSAWVLEPLDQPQFPRVPVNPNKPLTVGVGTIFGVAAGIGLLLLREYLSSADAPPDEADFPQLPEEPAGAPSPTLGHQVLQAQRAGRPFSLGVLSVASGNGEQSRVRLEQNLSSVADVLRLTLRDEDALTYLSDGTFVVMLPGMSVAAAETLLGGWEAGISSILSCRDGDEAPKLSVSSGVCEYRDNLFAGDGEAQRIAETLVSQHA